MKRALSNYVLKKNRGWGGKELKKNKVKSFRGN